MNQNTQIQLRLKSPKRTPGPARFLAVVINMLVVLGSSILVLLSGLIGAEYLLLYLVVNAAISIVFIALRGTWGEIGRGMLIAWLSIPVGLIVIMGGIVLGHVLVGGK